MYRPILRAKAGEFAAIAALTPDSAQRIAPIIELPPRDFDFEKGQPKKTITEHINGLTSRVKETAFPFPLVYIDSCCIDTDIQDDDRHCFDLLQEVFNQKVVSSVPVIHYSSPPATIQAALKSHQKYRRGVAVRLNTVAIRDVVNNAELLNKLCSNVEAEFKDVDLFLDVGSVTSDPASAEMVSSFAITRIKPDEFRSITVVASSVPHDVSGIVPFQKTILPRNEWQLWRNLQRIYPRISYGDFGTQSPGQALIDMRNVVNTMRAKARYSCDAGWLILAGTAYTEDPDQYFRIAKLIASDPLFLGSDFSWGDYEIQKRSERQSTAGSLQTWVSITTNHHLRFISSRLANDSAT